MEVCKCRAVQVQHISQGTVHGAAVGDNVAFGKHAEAGNDLLNEVKEDISEIGKRLKELRKEILLIDDIAERSNEIEEKLEQAEIDEQKKLQKEEKYRE